MIRKLLDRLFPHDTLMIAGKPYMHRWYVFGYAPPPDEPEVKADATGQAPGAKREGWRWRDYGLGAFRIHCTVASDDSRAYHDHPWPFVSVGIRGSYEELRPPYTHLPDGDGGMALRPPAPDVLPVMQTFRAPFVNRKAATDLHLLRVVDGPVWSLFFTRPKQRSWGFAGPFGWMGWRDFDANYPERNAWVES